MELAAFIGICTVFALFGLVCILLTLIGMPGTWLMVLSVLLIKWWQPELLSWWTIGIAVTLALIGEIIEFVAGAAGSGKAGGGKMSAAGAIIGGIVGAIAGAAFPPVVGAIIWGAVGAGLGAILGEITTGRPWRETLPIGGGAAAGKFIGTITKTAIAAAIFLLFFVALIIG